MSTAEERQATIRRAALMAKAWRGEVLPNETHPRIRPELHPESVDYPGGYVAARQYESMVRELRALVGRRDEEIAALKEELASVEDELAWAYDELEGCH